MVLLLFLYSLHSQEWLYMPYQEWRLENITVKPWNHQALVKKIETLAMQKALYPHSWSQPMQNVSYA